MATDGEGTITVTPEDWCAFLMEQIPKDLRDQVLFGPPRVVDGHLVVDFAWSTGDGTHPDSWAQKPLALRQWDYVKNLDKSLRKIQE